MRGFYFITDSFLTRKGNIADVKEAVQVGVAAVQYRNKKASNKEAFAEVLEIKKACKGIPLIINDRVDLALAVDADGVHLGENDMPYEIARRILGDKKVIGLSIRNVEEARQAQSLGADYIGVGSIFSTTTKADAGSPVGVDVVQEIKKVCNLPVVAIGGITRENAKEVVNAGADCIVAISQTVGKDNIREEIKYFQELF